MVTETTNIDAALLPERHPQQDLFICDVADAVLKDIMQHMEHPFYSLSNKPETKVRRYEHNGKLLKKSGSQSPMKRFKQMIKELAASDHLPDYSVAIDDDEIVHFESRDTIASRNQSPQDVIPVLKPETKDKAREAAPGWDIYNLEREWRGWITEPPRDADAAFVGFCRKWYERRGLPK